VCKPDMLGQEEADKEANKEADKEADKEAEQKPDKERISNNMHEFIKLFSASTFDTNNTQAAKDQLKYLWCEDKMHGSLDNKNYLQEMRLKMRLLDQKLPELIKLVTNNERILNIYKAMSDQSS